MLAFVLVLAYRVVVEKFTANLENNSRELELTKEEWDIVQQLCNVLMVRGSAIRVSLNQHFPHALSKLSPNRCAYLLMTTTTLGFETCHRILFASDT